MILLRRILSIVCAIGLFVVFEVMIAQQQLFWYLVPLSVGLTVFPVGMILNWRQSSREFWQFLITPVILVGSSLFLLLFLNDPIFTHILIAVVCLLFWWYNENIFLFHYRAQEYQPYALEHISLYVNLLSVFFLYAALYATRVFLNFPMVYLILAGAVVSALFSVQLMVGSKVPWQRSRFLMFVMTMVMLELFLAVSILPTTFFVAGLLVAIPYYLMMNVTRHMLRQDLSRRVVVRNVIIGVVSFAITLAAAPWT